MCFCGIYLLMRFGKTFQFDSVDCAAFLVTVRLLQIKHFELRRDRKYLSNPRRSKNITLKHWTWRLFLLQINSFTARNWRQRKQALESNDFFFIVLQYFLTWLFKKSISLPSPYTSLFRAANSFRFTWSKGRCQGVTRPFASDTSPKRIDRKGLGIRRTGTR